MILINSIITYVLLTCHFFFIFSQGWRKAPPPTCPAFNDSTETVTLHALCMNKPGFCFQCASQKLPKWSFTETMPRERPTGYAHCYTGTGRHSLVFMFPNLYMGSRDLKPIKQSTWNVQTTCFCRNRFSRLQPTEEIYLCHFSFGLAALSYWCDLDWVFVVCNQVMSEVF